jgi:pimeloyl-ACP methyl ester carboxylesterase
MLQHSEANFFKTDDNEQLFYVKNFAKLNSEKPMLLFNYGLVCSNHHWQYQIEFFDKRGYQILIHDYRGHFQSTGGHNLKKLTFQQLAHDVFKMCEFLGVSKAILLGHSMGVNVSLQIAKDYPGFVEGMILISGTFINVRDIMFDSNIMEFLAPVATLGLEKYPDVFKKLWAVSGANPIIREIIHSTGFNKKMVPREFIEIYLNRVSQLGADIFFQLFNEMTTQNIIGSLKNMNIPSLVIGGYRDNVIPNHLQRTLATLLPNSETYFIKNGSHVPQADFPGMINERIEIFLNKNFILS